MIIKSQGPSGDRAYKTSFIVLTRISFINNVHDLFLLHFYSKAKAEFPSDHPLSSPCISYINISGRFLIKITGKINEICPFAPTPQAVELLYKT